MHEVYCKLAVKAPGQLGQRCFSLFYQQNLYFVSSC